MRTFIFAFALIFAGFIGFSCKSGETLASKEEMAQVSEKVESMNFTFVPQTAEPMSGRSVSLSSFFSLKVSKDTINSDLPYFGRAYSAPLPNEGGIKFISTDFDYTVSENKKGWDITIVPKDNSKGYKLSLTLGQSGYGSLSVQQMNRQSISFYGKID